MMGFFVCGFVRYFAVMPGGRPPLYDNVEQLEKAIDKYFHTNEIKSITGLAYHLGFESRISFYDYEKRGEFSYTIKRARLMIEMFYEMQLTLGTSNAGAIFALKNFGWTDRSEVDQRTQHTGTIKHTLDYSKLSDAALKEIKTLHESEPETSGD